MTYALDRSQLALLNSATRIPVSTVEDRIRDREGANPSSLPPPDAPDLDHDHGDTTDEEDWESMGLAALRQGSSAIPSAPGETLSRLKT